MTPLKFSSQFCCIKVSDITTSNTLFTAEITFAHDIDIQKSRQLKNFIMGKAKAVKRNASASSGPYQKPDKSSKGAKNNTIFKFNTNLGQHILKNGDVCTRIVDAAAIQPHDTVLEVGPGTGALTSLLLDKARDVTAVELDPRMAAELSRRVQGTPKQRKLKILLGDFIKLDMSEIPQHDVCVSNTPYQVSKPRP